MTTCGMGGDLLSNFSLSGGMCGCHSTWDLTPTITGDLALTKDETENNRQHLLMWLALPKGERLNPSLGCCLHDYFHRKITGTIYRELSLDIGSDLKSVFPEVDIKNIVVESISDLSGGNRTMQIGITLGDDDLQFVADFNTITEINDTINSLLYYGGANWGVV
jgi:hypothetical protein